MSESSYSDNEDFHDAIERMTPNNSLVSKKNNPPQQHFKTTKQNNRKESSHSRGNSTSFEEYSYGNSPQKNFRRHSRVQSWSDTMSQQQPPQQQQQRKNHDLNKTILVGIHNQYHPPTNEPPPHGKPHVKIKTKIKTNKRFNRIVLAQTLAVDVAEACTTAGIDTVDDVEEGSKEPAGAIWASRFSKDGKYMATGGQSCTLKVWKVLRDLDRDDGLCVQDINPHEPSIKVFHDAPVRIYTGHMADILDISWSKNNFIVTSSMDKTVRLWHVSQKVCLCVFKHLDVVSSVKFHPKDDRFFLSGSLDCKVRLWSIPEKRVAFWNEIPAGNMVTAVGFTLDGRTVCVGANTGDLFFFETQGLKYNTQILVKKNHNKKGKKITGIEPMPGMPLGEERVLVTTNDSRIWIINMKDKSLVHKYKGIQNSSMQIKASFSDDGRYIISGSEDGCVYLWCTDQVAYSPFQHLQDSRIKAAVALGHLGDQLLQTIMQNNGNFSEEPLTGMSSWLKKGERFVIDKLRSRNVHFIAHQHIVTSAIFAPIKTRQQLAKAKGDIIFENTPVYTHKENLSDFDDTSTYEDAVSERRQSIHSSHNRPNSLLYNDMNEIRQSLMDEFEEATQEERDQFDYPDSQIIISSDLHGSIKVWRMDSGLYEDKEELAIYPPYSDNSYYTTSAPNHKAPTLYSSRSSGDLSLSPKSTTTSHKKGTFSNFFSKFK